MEWRRWIAAAAGRARVLRRAQHADDDLHDELAFHVAMQSDADAQRGLPASEAERRARLALGGIEQTKEHSRDVRPLRWAAAFGQDARYTWRSLRRTPAFTSVALLTLALGIGANTAMFSIVNGILLQPLPYADAGALVLLHQASPKQGISHGRLSLPDFEDWRAAQSLSAMAAYDVVPQVLTGRGEPLELQAAYVTGGFFDVFGVPAQRGRLLDADDHRLAARRVVISDRLWRSRLAAAPGIVGDSIRLRGEAFTIVGVATAAFQFPTPETDVWAPESVLSADAIGERVRDNRVFEGVARLAPGVDAALATNDLSTVARRLAAEHPESNAEWTAVTVVPLRTAIVGHVDRALLVTLAVVGCILLIACANLANLLLARGTSRAREMAVRAALGAGRLRIVRQLITENVVLALLGGALALAVTVWGVRGVVALSGDILPRAENVRVDALVLAFGLGISLVAGLLLGLVPALRAVHSPPDLHGGRGATGHGKALRSTLVAVEVGLAVVLVIGAGLMARSFLRLRAVDPGFDARQVLTVVLQLNLADVPSAGMADHLVRRREEIIERVKALPGVAEAGMINAFPLRDDGSVFEYRRTDDRGNAEATPLRADTRYVSPGYTRAMGIALRRGAPLPDRWPEGAPVPVLVSETASRRFWPGQEPIGRTLGSRFPRALIVVGVVADVRQRALAEAPPPTFYLPQSIAPRLMATLAVRTAGDPQALASPIRKAIREIDPDQSIRSLMPLSGVLSASVARDRFFTLLFGLFGGLALALAAIGVYGVVAYSVGQRTREIGLRMALGARAVDVTRLVVREGMGPVAAGLALGAIAALLVTRTLQRLLYEISAVDPLAFVTAAAVLAAAAFVACYVPARRATRIDPMQALRTD